MALPDTLERAGIVVGSAMLVSLPVSALLAVLVPDLAALSDAPVLAAWLAPGTVVGALVALDRLPASYRDIWLFSILAWLVTFGLWQAFGGEFPPASRPVGVATWAVGAGFAGLATWRREWLLGTVASEPDDGEDEDGEQQSE